MDARVLDLIVPEWPAPVGVKAFQTTRAGGVSSPPFDGLNLGAHVGDEGAVVQVNRQILEHGLRLPAPPSWLNQVHGVNVIDPSTYDGICGADGSVTRASGVVLGVMTADCLPLLLCEKGGLVVGAAHAGWRGLLQGVIEETVAAMGCASGDLIAWIGPAIGPYAFEVGGEVRSAFLAADSNASACFVRGSEGRWLADLYGLARQRLGRSGVEAIYGGGFCTYTAAERFYSYRRDGQTGRMATLIWRE